MFVTKPVTATSIPCRHRRQSYYHVGVVYYCDGVVHYRVGAVYYRDGVVI
ncbi:MAG: hypothetical protein MJY90_01405 [Bacteroidaceae bacterium]|nr:hypothetical protein [Bacteroidaceae bacterium]